MRILLKLRCLSAQKYSNDHVYALHSFIYGLLRDTQYEYLHDYAGRKYFTYTNLYPPNDFEIDNKYNIIVSTPDNNLGNVFLNGLYEYLTQQIELDDLRFIMMDIRLVNMELKAGDMIETGTPIVIKDNNSYWGYRDGNQNIQDFIQLLGDSLTKKYNQFHNTNRNFKLLDCIRNLRLKRITSVSLIIKKEKCNIIGSKWNFKIRDDISKYNLEFLQFCFDAGFGQKTAMGFGCMNRRLN